MVELAGNQPGSWYSSYWWTSSAPKFTAKSVCGLLIRPEASAVTPPSAMASTPPTRGHCLR